MWSVKCVCMECLKATDWISTTVIANVGHDDSNTVSRVCYAVQIVDTLYRDTSLRSDNGFLIARCITNYNAINFADESKKSQ